MPRPAYSIDLPSPKLFDHIESMSDGRETDNDTDFDIPESFGVPQHARSISQASNSHLAGASWETLPHKNQLAILALAMIAEFYHIASLQTVMFQQLRSFEKEASESKIAWQAGILQGSFGAAQTVSAVLWKGLADSPRMGRKRVLLASFVSAFISCVGIAFAPSFTVALCWRLFAGLLNGTTATVRNMVVETVETKFHSRALMILPIASYIAYIIGPVLSGLLSDPYDRFPYLFGAKSLFGGKKGLRWMQTYPFAVSHCMSAVVMLVVGSCVYLGLVETLGARTYFRDPGLELAALIQRRLPRVFRRKRTHYTRLSINDALIFEAPSSPTAEQTQGVDQISSGNQTPSTEYPPISIHDASPTHKRNVSRNLMVKRSSTWTVNALFTLAATGILHFHIGAFSTLWPCFLSISGARPTRSLFGYKDVVDAGLSFGPLSIGMALAILGVIGITLQMLLHPRTTRRVGKAESFNYALFFFPIAYCLMPFLATIPHDYIFEVWLCIAAVLLLHVIGQSFTLPAGLINNDSSPHATMICSFNGVGQSISTPSSAMGSSIAGALLAMGLQGEAVATAWWAMAGVSAFGCLPLFWIRNDSSESTPKENGFSDWRRERRL